MKTKRSALPLIIALFLFGGCEREVDVEASLASARASIASGEPRQAMVALREILFVQPESPPARLMMANIMFGLGDREAAMVQLAPLLSAEPPSSEALVLQAQVRLAGGEFAAVLESIEQGALMEIPAGVRARLHAAALAGLDRRAEAVRLLDDYLGGTADDYEAMELLARVSFAAGDSERSLELSAAVVAGAPAYARGWVTRASALRAAGDRAGARAAYDRALGLIVKDSDAHLYVEALNGAGDLSVASGDLDAARFALSGLSETVPGSTLVHRLGALIALSTNDLQQAAINLQQWLTIEPDSIEAQFLMGVTHLRRGFEAQAEVFLERVVNDRPDHLPAAQLLAELRRQDAPNATPGDGGVALAEIPTGGGAETAAADALRKAAEMREAGRVDDARALLEQAAREYPSSALPHVALASLDWSIGRSDAAVRRLDEFLMDQPGDLAALVARGRAALLLEGPVAASLWLGRAEAVDADADITAAFKVAIAQAQGPAEALEAARELTRRSPDRPIGHYLLGTLALRSGRVPEAIAALERAQELAPEAGDVLLALASAYLSGSDTGRAEPLVDAALEQRPMWLDAGIAKIRILAATGRTEEALTLVSQLGESHPTRFEVDLLRAEILRAANRPATAAAVFAAAIDKGAGEAGVLQLFRLLVATNAADPERPLLEWLEREPGESSVAVRFALAQHYHARGALPETVEQYRRLVELRPGNAVFANNLAIALQDRGESDAVAVARRAHELEPDNGAITDTLGWILAQRGDAEGIALLEAAVRQAPDSMEIRLHFAQALADQGQDGRALGVLRELPAGGGSLEAIEQARRLRARLESGAAPN
jgi:predicted Zn-dependent protease